MDIKKQEELAFNKRFSRFKLQIFFKRRPAITHYGNERIKCSIDQIKFGHVKTVRLNREQGLQDCINRIAICQNLYGAYQTAVIYDRKKSLTLPDGTVQQGREVIKYVCGQLVESEDVFISESEKNVYTEVVYSTKNGTKVFDLRPIDQPIDFKREVEKALQQS